MILFCCWLRNYNRFNHTYTSTRHHISIITSYFLRHPAFCSISNITRTQICRAQHLSSCPSTLSRIVPCFGNPTGFSLSSLGIHRPKGCVPPLFATPPPKQNQMHIKNDLPFLTAAFSTSRCDGYITLVERASVCMYEWIQFSSGTLMKTCCHSIMKKIAKISGITD